MSPEFRAGEAVAVRLTCCDCGGEAEGNVICEHGDLCDACHAGTSSPKDCKGHPPGPFDPMGETVYCDGSCRR